MYTPSAPVFMMTPGTVDIIMKTGHHGSSQVDTVVPKDWRKLYNNSK